MTSLTAIFGSSDDKPEEESQKLLDLYWNRAELKKEFADLRKEKFRLQDLIEQQEGSVARVQQKLNHLEQLLLDPEWVYNVVTYYQLKALNLRCQSKLEKFAEQLKQQREQRQHNQKVSDWTALRDEEAAGIQAQIGEHRMKVQMLEDGLQVERHRLATMNGLVRFFKRRSVTATLDNLAESIEQAQAEEQELLLRLDAVENREPPGVEGLDIPTKRMINFMILAFTQQVYLHFKPDDLAGLAKEAGDKSVGAVNYGGKESCDEIIARVAKRIASFDKVTDFADVLQQRAKLIADKAVFRSDDDAVPVSGTVSTVFDINRKGVIKTSDANLLGENYWNLTNIVSR